MTNTELCIRRPVMTILLSMATVVAGVIAYTKIPVAALPSFNSPVIQVSATLSGASPENMAASVALPLEKEFSTIDGITVISSTNFLSTTSITLEFNNDRDIDEAAVDVQHLQGLDERDQDALVRDEHAVQQQEEQDIGAGEPPLREDVAVAGAEHAREDRRRDDHLEAVG